MHTLPLPLARLAVFTPFSKLSDEQLILLSYHIELCHAEAGSEISPMGDSRLDELFLLNGQVEIQSEKHDVITLSAEDDRSRFSLLNIRPSPNQIVSYTPVEYFWLSPEFIQSLQAEYSPSDQPLAEILANEKSHPLVIKFYRSLLADNISLPALPEVTLRVSKAIADEGSNVHHISTLIAADASISARILKLANSPLYRACQSISQLPEAIKRLGLNATRHLILAFALHEQHQQLAPNWIRKRLLRSWKESIQLASLCYVLAKKCTKIPPEEALLAGLLHNIGELPLLQFCDQYPELANDPDYLDQIIQEARGQAGAMILHRWNLPRSLVVAVQHADTWFYEANGEEATLTDILILARLHSLAMNDASPFAPDIRQVPSYEKVSPGALTKEQRLEILEDAKEQITEIKNLLNH